MSGEKFVLTQKCITVRGSIDLTDEQTEALLDQLDGGLELGLEAVTDHLKEQFPDLEVEVS